MRYVPRSMTLATYAFRISSVCSGNLLHSPSPSSRLHRVVRSGWISTSFASLGDRLCIGSGVGLFEAPRVAVLCFADRSDGDGGTGEYARDIRRSPDRVLFDRMKAVATFDGRDTVGTLVVNEEFQRFTDHWIFRVRACRPSRA